MSTDTQTEQEAARNLRYKTEGDEISCTLETDRTVTGEIESKIVLRGGTGLPQILDEVQYEVRTDADTIEVLYVQELRHTAVDKPGYYYSFLAKEDEDITLTCVE